MSWKRKPKQRVSKEITVLIKMYRSYQQMKRGASTYILNSYYGKQNFQQSRGNCNVEDDTETVMEVQEDGPTPIGCLEKSAISYHMYPGRKRDRR